MEETGYTLVTGGTGLIGQILLRDLTRARLPVAVLVRPARDAQGRQRIDRQLQRAEQLLQRQFLRPVILQGDLADADLGLSTAEQRWVQSHCRRVLHCAASVSFRPAKTHRDNEPFRTNVEGTRHLAEFCLARGIREFHHISSAYACGVREGIILETDGAGGQSFSNDYEASKSQAEEYLKSLPELGALTIYRPSIVIDPSRLSSGLGDRTVYLAFSVLQLLSQRGELPPPAELLQTLGLSGAERKNIVPAAWVSRMIVQILRRPNLHGGVYHLTHHQGTTVLDLLTAFRDVLMAASDSSFSRSKSDQMEVRGQRSEDRGQTDKSLNFPATDPRPLTTPPHCASNVEELSVQRSAALKDLGELGTVVEQFIETFAPYFRDDPKFDRAQLQHALHVCGEADCPEVNRDLLQDLARQQMRHTEKDRARPVFHTSKSETENRWQLLQNMFPADAGAVSPHVECVGLMLSGTGGGDWQLILDETGRLSIRPEGAASTNRSIYASVQTWNQLIHGQLPLSRACMEGRILVEFSEPDVEESQLQETLQQILSILMTGHHSATGSPEQQDSLLSDSAIPPTSPIHSDGPLWPAASAESRYTGDRSLSHFSPEGESPC